MLGMMQDIMGTEYCCITHTRSRSEQDRPAKKFTWNQRLDRVCGTPTALESVPDRDSESLGVPHALQQASDPTVQYFKHSFLLYWPVLSRGLEEDLVNRKPLMLQESHAVWRRRFFGASDIEKLRPEHGRLVVRCPEQHKKPTG